MTPSYVVFQTLYDQIEVPFLSSVAGLVQSFSDYARRPIQAAMVLYIVFVGLMMAGGKGGSANEVMTHTLKLALIAWFATDATAYSTWVQQFFLVSLPADLANAVVTRAGGTAAPTAWAFDMIWQHSWEAGWSAWKQLSVADLGEEIVVVLFWMAALISVGLAFAIWMMSQIVLALYIIIGPLLIGLALFSATRSIFARWIGGMVSSVLLQVGILILLALTLRTEAALVVQIPSTVGPNVYTGLNLLLSCIVVFLLCGLLAFQMPGWATSLAGGMQFHGGALALIMLTQIKGATGAISGAGGAIDKGISSLRGGPSAPPGDSLSGANNGGRKEAWMQQIGGYDGLSDPNKSAATMAYGRWISAKPELGARHDLRDYVSYVQQQQASREDP